MSARSLLEEEVAFDGAETGARVLILACGAIAREVLAVISLNGWTHVDVRCLPAKLHSTPDRIPAAVDAKLTELKGRYERVFVAYADCGTGGAPRSRARSARASSGCRAPTATGSSPETTSGTRCRRTSPATFYLTDFLARHFDALVVRGAQARHAIPSCCR